LAQKDKRYSKRGDYISLNSEDLNLGGSIIKGRVVKSTGMTLIVEEI